MKFAIAALALVAGNLTLCVADETNRSFETRLGALKAFSTQGQGNQATEKFALQQGLAVFRIEHQGKSNFTVELIDGTTGDSIGNLVNESGKFEGTLATNIRRPGSYILKIEGDGAWQIAAGQPRPQDIDQPGTIEGQGFDISQFVALDKGLAVFRFEKQDEGSLSVWMLDANGKRVEHLVNVRGNYEGSKPTKIEEAGTYLFNIEAEGRWTLSIEQ